MGMLRGIGAPELLIILLIVVFIFGASRIKDVFGAMGQGLREFRKSQQEDEAPERPHSPAADVSETQPPGTSHDGSAATSENQRSGSSG